jgi:hypothetical protein
MELPTRHFLLTPPYSVQLPLPDPNQGVRAKVAVCFVLSSRLLFLLSLLFRVPITSLLFPEFSFNHCPQKYIFSHAALVFFFPLDSFSIISGFTIFVKIRSQILVYF